MAIPNLPDANLYLLGNFFYSHLNFIKFLSFLCNNLSVLCANNLKISYIRANFCCISIKNDVEHDYLRFEEDWSWFEWLLVILWAKITPKKISFSRFVNHFNSYNSLTSWNFPKILVLFYFQWTWAMVRAVKKILKKISLSRNWYLWPLPP